MRRTKAIVQKAIVITLTALCFLTFGFVLFLDGYYYKTRPREPDPETGRIYPQDVKTIQHVARVYLTRTERMPYDYFWFFFMALALTAYLLNRRWKALRNPREGMPKELC